MELPRSRSGESRSFTLPSAAHRTQGCFCGLDTTLFKQGWTAVEKRGKPDDLRCTRGTDERHVEGITGAANSVELTINEVLHTRDKDSTVGLCVVSGHQGRHLHRPPAVAPSGTTAAGSRPGEGPQAPQV